jgi:hypothetical protein
LEFLRSETLEQKVLHLAQIASHRDRFESALRAEVSCELLLDTTHWGSIDYLRVYRNAVETPQETEQLSNGECLATLRATWASAMLQKQIDPPLIKIRDLKLAAFEPTAELIEQM